VNGEVGPSAGSSARMARAEARWQRQLLPFMVTMVVGLTVFFFVASLVQLYHLQQRIEHGPSLDLDRVFGSPRSDPPGLSSREAIQWQTLVALEAHALQRRYHQANVLLMARIWTRYLGFVTGMILTLVGAAFVLGRLREDATKLEGEAQNVKLGLTTASPGLVLAVLGTLLMVIAMVTQTEIAVKDSPVYLVGSEPAAPPPRLLPRAAGQPSGLDPAKELEDRLKGGSAPSAPPREK
jgi:hypothetical protein